MRAYLSTLTILLILAACAPKSQSPEIVAEEYYKPTPPLTAEDAAATISNDVAPGFPQKAASKGDVVIGMLVPLTGPQAQLGAQIRDAALLALYDKQKSLTVVERIRNPQLIIRDTGSGAEAVATATQELLDKGAKVILGPLMAADVKVASALTLKHGVPLISFSNSEQVAKPDVYLFGFDPAEQIRRVAGYALKQQIVHYAAIAPQNDYGRKVVQQLSTQVAEKKQSLQPVEFFTEGKSPSPLSMNRIYRAVTDWGKERKAIFLPMTGKPLAETSTAILTHKNIGAPYVKLLGTGLWDDPQILGIPALQGAWFATSHPNSTAWFNKKFKQTYDYPPIRLASLGYDAVALVTTLALENGDEAFSRKTLTERDGFSGPANGVFRLTPEGYVERALAVVEIAGGQLRVIDPAPEGFRR